MKSFLWLCLWHQNGVRRCLACASGLRRPQDRVWVKAAAIEPKWRNMVRTVKRRNGPCRFHALVEMRRDRRTPVVRLSGEPPRDPNQSSAPPVIDYNRLTPGETKETHHMRLSYPTDFSPQHMSRVQVL